MLLIGSHIGEILPKIFMKECLKSQMKVKNMSGEITEIWVIDGSNWRRSCISIQATELGYLTFHVDPIRNLLEIYRRPVVAIMHDDGCFVDRILDCRHKRSISCVVYSDSWKAKRASDLLRQGVGALMDWPCQSQEIAKAVAVAACGRPAKLDNAWPANGESVERIAAVWRSSELTVQTPIRQSSEYP